MEYKIKNIALNVENLDEIQFPHIKDRTIEKHGDVIEFTFHEIENDKERFTKLKQELEAYVKHEKAAIENVEHFHPFVKEVSEEQLSTYAVYFKYTSSLKAHAKKLEEVEKAIIDLDAEIEEMLKQIPELNVEEEPKNEENA